MDSKELVALLRTNCMLAAITTKALGGKSEVDETVRKGITSCQTEAKDALYDMSAEFGAERLVPNSSYGELVSKVGGATSSFRTQVSALPENQRDYFAMSLSFRPIEDPDGFGLLPERVAAGLRHHVESRLVRNYDQGMEALLKRLNSALAFYSERVGAYHAYMNAPEGKTRAILRDVVVGNLVSTVQTTQRLNITNSPRIQVYIDGLGDVITMPAQSLRDDKLNRERALSLVADVHASVRGALGIVDDKAA